MNKTQIALTAFFSIAATQSAVGCVDLIRGDYRLEATYPAEGIYTHYYTKMFVDASSCRYKTKHRWAYVFTCPSVPPASKLHYQEISAGAVQPTSTLLVAKSKQCAVTIVSDEIDQASAKETPSTTPPGNASQTILNGNQSIFGDRVRDTKGINNETPSPSSGITKNLSGTVPQKSKESASSPEDSYMQTSDMKAYVADLGALHKKCARDGGGSAYFSLENGRMEYYSLSDYSTFQRHVSFDRKAIGRIVNTSGVRHPTTFKFECASGNCITGKDGKTSSYAELSAQKSATCSDSESANYRRLLMRREFLNFFPNATYEFRGRTP